MLTSSGRGPARQDVLVPSAALLPLSDLRGGQFPVTGEPGTLRPLSAALGVAPPQAGKHDTTGSRWYEDDATEKSDDGVVIPDTVKVLRTDT
ncbi:MAG: hypothetical protein ACRDRK_07270 [Pseudonocardia sp.]